MVFFVGLSFSPGRPHYYQIQKYRQRFDYKYSRSEYLQMSLLPPFKLGRLSRQQLCDFEQDLVETIESHLLGDQSTVGLVFNSLEFKLEQRAIVYLKVNNPESFYYLIEALKEIVEAYGGSFFGKKKKGLESLSRLLLPIGRMAPDDLFCALEQAKDSFEFPLKMNASSICLFEKKPGRWPLKSTLFSYPIEESYLMELSFG